MTHLRSLWWPTKPRNESEVEELLKKVYQHAGDDDWTRTIREIDKKYLLEELEEGAESAPQQALDQQDPVKSGKDLGYE